MNWDALDYIAAAALLLSAASGFYIVTRFSTGPNYMAATGLAAITALALVWMSLAVGLLGPAGHPAELAYAAALLAATIGAVLVRFRPMGLAVVLGGMAFAQLLIGVIALAAGAASGEAVFASLLFALLWLASAALYRRAARERARQA